MNGWLCVSADKSEIAYAGNDGYDEELGIYYSWDSTVNNASRLSEGDLIAIWNKKQLLGFSIIDRIELSNSTKRFFTCPSCKKSAIKARKTKTPIYRCQQCGNTFDERVEAIGREPSAQKSTKQINTAKYSPSTWMEPSKWSTTTARTHDQIKTP